MNAYKALCNYIDKNVPQENDGDEEETLARKIYKETNVEKINKNLVTIQIPSAHADAWENVLTAKYGPSAKDNSKTDNGKQFDTNNGIHIKIWKKKKFVSTMLIDGKKEYLTFAHNVLPQLYQEVLKIIPLTIQTDFVNKAKLDNKPETRKNRFEPYSKGEKDKPSKDSSCSALVCNSSLKNAATIECELS